MVFSLDRLSPRGQIDRTMQAGAIRMSKSRTPIRFGSDADSVRDPKERMREERSRPIVVLQLCEHFGNRTASFHGVARSFELWVPELDRSPFRVLLCSRAVPGTAALERFGKVGVEPLSLGYGKLDPRNLFALLRLMRRERVDILHLHGYGACTWGRIAGHLLGVPAIVHERCNYRTVPWFQRPVERILGPLTRYAFAVSESTRQFTIDKRYIPADRVRLLYSGIPLKGIPALSAAERRRIRSEHGVGDDDFCWEWSPGWNPTKATPTSCTPAAG